MRLKKPKKEFTYTWVCEPFAAESTYYEKRMFGGLAIYLQGRMVLVLVEDPGETAYRGKTYDCDLWDGLMLPTERVFHAGLIKEFPALRPHPVLGKWLYLSARHEAFEETACAIGERIGAYDKRFGIDPDLKTKGKRKK